LAGFLLGVPGLITTVRRADKTVHVMQVSSFGTYLTPLGYERRGAWLSDKQAGLESVV
jgi:hypothetical protein